ncbi:MAG: DUF2007 domain-containing protein [Bacteroidia bacterium]
MPSLVTLKSFLYTHEAGVARALLDSHGISTYLLNEHTVQAMSLYSTALGGVHLQVSKEDAAKAFEILKENGMIEENHLQESKLIQNINNWVSNTNKWTSKLPFIKDFNDNNRLFIVAFIILLLIALLIFATYSVSVALLPLHKTKGIGNGTCLNT